MELELLLLLICLYSCPYLYIYVYARSSAFAFAFGFGLFHFRLPSAQVSSVAASPAPPFLLRPRFSLLGSPWLPRSLALALAIPRPPLYRVPFCQV
jgi:hypothetical protein